MYLPGLHRFALSQKLPDLLVYACQVALGILGAYHPADIRFRIGNQMVHTEIGIKHCAAHMATPGEYGLRQCPEHAAGGAEFADRSVRVLCGVSLSLYVCRLNGGQNRAGLFAQAAAYALFRVHCRVMKIQIFFLECDRTGGTGIDTASAQGAFGGGEFIDHGSYLS